MSKKDKVKKFEYELHPIYKGIRNIRLDKEAWPSYESIFALTYWDNDERYYYDPLSIDEVNSHKLKKQLKEIESFMLTEMELEFGNYFQSNNDNSLHFVLVDKKDGSCVIPVRKVIILNFREFRKIVINSKKLSKYSRPIKDNFIESITKLSESFRTPENDQSADINKVTSLNKNLVEALEILKDLDEHGTPIIKESMIHIYRDMSFVIEETNQQIMMHKLLSTGGARNSLKDYEIYFLKSLKDTFEEFFPDTDSKFSRGSIMTSIASKLMCKTLEGGSIDKQIENFDKAQKLKDFPR